MNNQQQQKWVAGFLGLLALIAVFFTGSYVGQKSANSPGANVNIPKDINLTDEQFAPFWKVWKVLSEKYVAATTTDTQARVWGAIQGLASSQNDPYTIFFPPEETTTFKSDIAGNFEGVGMEIGLKDELLTVITPIKNSPAEKAGVRAGDKIIKIDDTDAYDLTVEKAVKLIRGPKGTTVKITFIREGQAEPLVKTIARDVIDIPTLETEVRGDVFIIRLFSFTAQSPNLFRNALRTFLQSGSNKLIVDLRGNPGGYLDAAWDIASWFLPKGMPIVTEDFGGKGTNRVYRSKGYDVLNAYFGKNYKVVILVNAGSASASEILAGALQEQGVAQLVGMKTFGKGSVQELVEITPETSLKVTIARWLTPKGHNLSHDGLNPDYEVKMTQKDLDAKKDPQLDKALEIIRK
ncbi:MAG: S41 family peptidase [Patescibacteria group bacterium]